MLLDTHTRDSSLGYVQGGYQLQLLAEADALAASGDRWSVPRWTGELVHHGYLEHGPPHAGDPRPMPVGTVWSELELQRVSDFRVTPLGREESDRIRRRSREIATDAALGAELPHLFRPWMNEQQRQAIGVSLCALRAALDAGQHAVAIGVSKDLVETACKLTLGRSGNGSQSTRRSLASLFKQALSATESGDVDVGGLLGPSLAATVDRLAHLRNVAGAGHGRVSTPVLEQRHARLAASAAVGIAAFLLCSTPAG